MIILLSIEMPDESTSKEVAAYLREQADNAAGQLEFGIIAVPEVDELTQIDFKEKELSDAGKFLTHQASISRSE